MTRKNLNAVILNSGNTKVHEMKKAEVCYDLLKDGHSFICEGKLNGNRGRPDITVLDTMPPLAYEIVCTEKEKSLLLKQKKYGEIIIVPIDARGK